MCVGLKPGAGQRVFCLRGASVCVEKGGVVVATLQGASAPVLTMRLSADRGSSSAQADADVETTTAAVAGTTAEAWAERLRAVAALADRVLHDAVPSSGRAVCTNVVHLVADGPPADSEPLGSHGCCPRSAGSSEVIYEGWLEKRGPTSDSAWRRRWCVLRRHALEYFADETQACRKGDVPITARTTALPFAPAAADRRSPRPAPGDAVKHGRERPFGFVVDPEGAAGGKGRLLFYFDAPTAEHMRAWTSSFAAAAAEAPSEEGGTPAGAAEAAEAAAAAAGRGRPAAGCLEEVEKPRAIVEGWLEKRGPTADSPWRRRWCVLRPSSLSYYDDESLAAKRGDLPIEGCTRALAFASAAAAAAVSPPSATNSASTSACSRRGGGGDGLDLGLGGAAAAAAPTPPWPSGPGPDLGGAARHRRERPFGFLVDPEGPAGGSRRLLLYFDAGSPASLKAWTSGLALAAAASTRRSAA